ncbi:unnamed protein product, partial [Mesorhabditis belari]|uniref:Protein kinase domain-containing protein n=1 Tax=Mesorhabditis belari TaxID=2138241 RepID=A0AAF3EYI1_9BILA
MNIEGIHKCDLFAAGLIIWELLERRNLPKDWATISFLHNLTAESKKLGDLILGCSSPSTRIEERFSVEEALERVESLKKVFQDLRHQHPGKFLVEPQICNQKKLLELPEGVFEPETVKTNFTFSILSFGGVAGGTGNYAVTENAPEIIVKLDPLMQTFLHEWTPKIERKSNFVKLSIPESEEKLNCIDSFKFLVNSNSVNEMRNRIGAEISMKINAFEEKAILAKEMQGLIEFIFEKHSAHDEAKQLIRNKITIYLLDKKFQSEELKSILEALSELLILDLNIQEILYRFSIYALWNCELMNLSWVELSELLQLAITNLEEAEMNFTRRKRFRTFNIGDSRAEWCTSFGISFRKDLTEIREDLLKNILTPRERHLDVIAIDLETFRRALYEKLDDVKRYSVNEVKNDPESVQTLEQFLKTEIELKKDPRIGFYFVYLKEKQIYTQYCHDGGEENEEREGLLIGLNVKSLNSFWHHDFRFESISHFCFTEFFRSVYIGLYELKPILDLMLQELRNMKTDVMESSYHKSMKEEINKFWKARQIFVLPKSAEIDANSAYKWQKSPSTRPDHKRRSF